MKVGYARVSTADQNLETQIEQLERAGCQKIFQEKESGAKSNRPELTKALDYIREGDVFVVTKLDRLARSMIDFWKILECIETKDVGLSILNMQLDTTTAQGRLMMGVLSSVAEFERSLILERQKEGIAKAIAAGKKFGRPALPPQIKDQVRLLAGSGIPKCQVANELGISKSSVYKVLQAAS